MSCFGAIYDLPLMRVPYTEIKSSDPEYIQYPPVHRSPVLCSALLVQQAMIQQMDSVRTVRTQTCLQGKR